AGRYRVPIARPADRRRGRMTATGVSIPPSGPAAPAIITPAQRQWARFRRNRAAVASMWLMLLIAVACAASTPLTAKLYGLTDLARARPPPAARAWFGTDLLGRSVAARCLFGGILSLAVGFAAAGISVFVGVTWGAVAGMAGGRTDAVMMRIVDV